MNSTISARRFLTALASLAALGLGAFALGFALDSHALAFFCITVGAFTTMIAVRDYAPTMSSANTARDANAARSAARRQPERMPLAA